MYGEDNYVKRTQKSYSLQFKLQVVKEVESGEQSQTSARLKYGIQGDNTVKKWLQKYGTFDWENQTPLNMPKTPEQRIMELEAKVKLLEKQKTYLEHQVSVSDKKAIIFDMMIDLAEKEYRIDIRKNSSRTIEKFRTIHKEGVGDTCRLFGVDRQIYYRSIKRGNTKRDKAEKVVAMVTELRQMMPRLGGRKMYYLLQTQLEGLSIGRDKFFAILKANHLLIVPKRTYHVTTNSMHRFKKHDNLLIDITIERPNQVWVADITYIGKRANPIYLSLITDAYSKDSWLLCSR
jgi:transposase-like protein